MCGACGRERVERREVCGDKREPMVTPQLQAQWTKRKVVTARGRGAQQGRRAARQALPPSLTPALPVLALPPPLFKPTEFLPILFSQQFS